MNIIISESQYKKILNENFNRDLQKIVKRINDKIIDTTNKVKKQYGINLRFLFTYGSAIGVLAPSIENYLIGVFPELSPEQISGLAITAIAVVFFTTNDYLKLKKELEKDGLNEELKVAIDKTEELRNKFSDMLNVLGISIYTLKDIAAYTFLLPVLGAINSVVVNHGISSIQFESLVESIITSGLITTSGVVVRDILQKVAKSIAGKNKEK
jgi:hypothetical protein